MFVAPDSFPFSQSILFLLAVMVGGAGWVLGPLVGAAVIVLLPELLSALAEYRLLFFGVLLLVVLWLAPEGIVGTLARCLRRVDTRRAARHGLRRRARSCAGAARRALAGRRPRHRLRRRRAANDVSFDRRARRRSPA